MTTFHVLAAVGDMADDLRSLGVYEAASARDALDRCLAELETDPLPDHQVVLRDREVNDLLRRDQTSCGMRSPSPTSRSS
jgi:hypothetical protein